MKRILIIVLLTVGAQSITSLPSCGQQCLVGRRVQLIVQLVILSVYVLRLNLLIQLIHVLSKHVHQMIRPKYLHLCKLCAQSLLSD